MVITLSVLTSTIFFYEACVLKWGFLLFAKWEFYHGVVSSMVEVNEFPCILTTNSDWCTFPNDRELTTLLFAIRSFSSCSSVDSCEFSASIAPTHFFIVT